MIHFTVLWLKTSTSVEEPVILLGKWTLAFPNLIRKINFSQTFRMPESLSCSFVCVLLLLNVQIDAISRVVTQAAALLALTSHKVLFNSKLGSCSKQFLWIDRRLVPVLLEVEYCFRLCFEEKTISSAWFLVLSPALKSRKLVLCWFKGCFFFFIHLFLNSRTCSCCGEMLLQTDKVLLLSVKP